jgi:hypothetical protein
MAAYIRTGTLTSPNEMLPLQMARGMAIRIPSFSHRLTPAGFARTAAGHPPCVTERPQDDERWKMHGDGAAPEPDDGEEPRMHGDGAETEERDETSPEMTAHGAVEKPSDEPEPRMTASGSVVDEDDEDESPPRP